MTSTHPVRHVSVSIERSPAEVYAFVSNPENLPEWATGLSGSIAFVDGKWVADSPMGKVTVEFAELNTFGVLDHKVTLESGESFYNPMRVVANGGGSEVTFTLIRPPGTSDEKFTQDAAWIEKDLRILKDVLERSD